MEKRADDAKQRDYDQQRPQAELEAAAGWELVGHAAILTDRPRDSSPSYLSPRLGAVGVRLGAARLAGIAGRGPLSRRSARRRDRFGPKSQKLSGDG